MVTAKEIPPGGVGEIKATFRSKGTQGKVRKAITVQTNDPDNERVRLSLYGEVIADVMVTPRHINFRNVQKGSPPDPLRFEVRLREGAGLKIREVSADSPYLVLEEEKRNDTEATYSVSLADNVPIGRLAGKVHVKTNSKKSALTKVNYYAFVQGSVKVTPQVLSFGLIRPGQSSIRDITLTGKPGSKFSVDRVSATTDAITSEILADAEGERYRVRVTYDPGTRTRGRVSEQVKIVVNGEEEETLQVPVYGNIHQAPPPRKPPQP